VALSSVEVSRLSDLLKGHEEQLIDAWTALRLREDLAGRDESQARAVPTP
jgi:hypothetical protein